MSQVLKVKVYCVT